MSIIHILLRWQKIVCELLKHKIKAGWDKIFLFTLKKTGDMEYYS